MDIPELIRPLANAWAIFPAPMNPILVIFDRMGNGNKGFVISGNENIFELFFEYEDRKILENQRKNSLDLVETKKIQELDKYIQLVDSIIGDWHR